MGGFDFLFSDFLSLHLVNTHTSHSLKAKIKMKTNTVCLALVENHVLIKFILTILSLAPNKCSKNMNIRYIHAHPPHIFIYSSVSGYLGCFHALVIAHSSAVNITLHVPFWVIVFSRYMPRNRTEESYGSSVLVFWGPSIVFLHSSYTSLHPTNNVGRFPFLHTLPNIYL